MIKQTLIIAKFISFDLPLMVLAIVCMFIYFFVKLFDYKDYFLRLRNRITGTPIPKKYPLRANRKITTQEAEQLEFNIWIEHIYKTVR